MADRTRNIGSENENRTAEQLKQARDAQQAAAPAKKTQREEHVVGDQVSEDRNLSGSSTWLTLDEQEQQRGSQDRGQPDDDVSDRQSRR